MSDDKQQSPENVMPPEGVNSVQAWLSKTGQNVRGYAQRHTPAFIVNSGSNLTGVAHLTGEFMMIKAYSPIKSADDLAKLEGKSRTLEEVKMFFGGALKSLPFRMSFSEALDPKFYADSFRAVADLEYATKRDMDKIGFISNRWGMRSAICGITAMSFASLLPDSQDTPEETERMAKMRTEHFGQYAGMRVGQALNPFGWAQHKREFTGLTMVGAGAFSVMNGLMTASGGVKYTRNWAHSIGGAITAAAGSGLILAIDNEKGWDDWGKINLLRLFSLPNSIATKYQKKQDGRHWYVGGVGAFQTSNIVSYLYGGVEKLPDGTIVDKDAVRKEAERKAKDETNMRRDWDFDGLKEEPAMQVKEVAGHERQMEKGPEQEHVAQMSV